MQSRLFLQNGTNEMAPAFKIIDYQDTTRGLSRLLDRTPWYSHVTNSGAMDTSSAVGLLRLSARTALLPHTRQVADLRKTRSSRRRIQYNPYFTVLRAAQLTTTC